MARTAHEDREQILAELAVAIDHIALATACLGAAYELLDEATADRLEAELFRPVQKAYGRAKRTHVQFAARFGLASRPFESPSAGLPSQGVKAFVERSVVAAQEAGLAIAELQDAGVEPQVWKIEGLERREDCEKIVAQCRADGRDQVVCVVLGRGAERAKVESWLASGAGVDGYVGFAIGRSIWGDPLAGFLGGSLSREAASEQIAGSYLHFLDTYETARQAARSSGS